MATTGFRTGSEKAEESAKRTSFSRTSFLSIEDGDHEIVRILTDHDRVITVDQHNSAPTRSAPKKFEGNWPERMGGVCRNDVAFDYPDCFLCIQFAETGDRRKYKPSPRTWGLGVVREKVMEEGRHRGFRDATIEVEIDGEKKTIPKVVIMNFAWGNFWSGFATIKDMYGTWCDRDVMVRRSGEELNTKYTMQSWDPVNIEGLPLASGGDPLDTRKADAALPYLAALGISKEQLKKEHGGDPQEAFFAALKDVVTERSSDEFYARFFDTRVEQPETRGGDSSSSGDQAEAAKPANDEPSEEELASLAARIQGHDGEGEPQGLSFDG